MNDFPSEHDYVVPRCVRASNKRLTLGDLKRGPEVPVTIAEYDVTPGLREWIEEEIDRREEIAKSHQQACGYWEYDSFVHQIRDHCNAGEVANVPCEGTGRFIEMNDPDDVLRRCASDRKILAAHPHAEATPDWALAYGLPDPPFACETCHIDEYYVSGGGNCDTILALAEAYGLEPAAEAEVEVVSD